MEVTLNMVKKDHEVCAYIAQADRYLEIIGYTEHGSRHARLIAKNARNILSELGYNERLCEMAAIAGYLEKGGESPLISRIRGLIPKVSAYYKRGEEREE
jgi:metal-dependent HD superfamily phosphatase/phosphodiesterase